MVQQALPVRRAADAGIESGLVIDDLGIAEPSQDAVPPHHAEHLTGHVRGKIHDPPILHAGIFAVRARQADDRALTELVECADDLRLLATHDVGHTVRVSTADAGDDEDPSAAVPIHVDARTSDGVEIHRTRQVWHLFPALPAADHAAHE